MTWHELLRKQCQDTFPRKTPLKGNLRGQRRKDVGNVGELKQIKKKKKKASMAGENTRQRYEAEIRHQKARKP